MSSDELKAALHNIPYSCSIIDGIINELEQVRNINDSLRNTADDAIEQLAEAEHEIECLEAKADTLSDQIAELREELENV